MVVKGQIRQQVSIAYFMEINKDLEQQSTSIKSVMLYFYFLTFLQEYENCQKCSDTFVLIYSAGTPIYVSFYSKSVASNDAIQHNF